ncbi:MAG: preprotein translocase subunit YajC [Nitrosomonadaceae bacterium]|jgi:preprotein translocase subunit YajC|nr:preprotein translocase subunit YajC [Nitrosospira sp.]MDW7564842.1 preprotein translocase subunit YajC [Nitrosomonadaceae bacterium]MBA0916006.1 preprotein translocase subunit YajC [Nitrosospira sp.]MBI0408959.1 preprotein translocase subunit YajC [Nitrosospira sp.]MBI0410904.1 preprotein translocase subunit YajC [Nitrosospira sp.]
MLISEAYAQAAAAPPGGDFLTTLPMIVIIFALFYFIVIRPQSKRAKEQKLMIEALQKGDEVVSSGGVLGRVVKISGSYIVLEIATSTQVTVLKSSVQTLLPKGTLKTVEKD